MQITQLQLEEWLELPQTKLLVKCLDIALENTNSALLNLNSPSSLELASEYKALTYLKNELNNVRQLDLILINHGMVEEEK